VNNSVTATVKPNKKNMLAFRGAMLGFVVGTGISIVPVCGIRRSMALIVSEPAQAIFFVEWILACAITGGALLPKFIQAHEPAVKETQPVNLAQALFKRLLMPLGALIFLLLYFAASALCQRLNMGVVHGGTLTTQILQYMGLALTTFGLATHGYALLAPARSIVVSENETTCSQTAVLSLRHPCFFAALVTLTGLPLVMGTWYPLFAIPGIFIVFKWIATEQERNLRERLGANYEEFQAKTKMLLPYLY
jgi:protein-S-isoprenylcysteine O-methyltransferase Ste14